MSGMSIQEILGSLPPEDLEFERLSHSVTLAIHDFMQEKGVTQKKLAKEIGISEARVSKMLAGDTNLTLRTIAKISLVLNVSAQFKFCNADDNFKWVNFRKDNFNERTWDRQNTVNLGDLKDGPLAA